MCREGSDITTLHREEMIQDDVGDEIRSMAYAETRECHFIIHRASSANVECQLRCELIVSALPRSGLSIPTSRRPSHPGGCSGINRFLLSCETRR